MIAQVQQHRGMSGAWLAGDKSFAARLPERQATIEGLFDALERDGALESTEAYPCFRIADIRNLRSDWQRLTVGLAQSTPEKSFQDHCQIVAKLLDWLRALGEARIEQPAGQRDGGDSVRNFSFRLPALAECLGQSRALSCSVAARGRCAPVARVRLLFLLGRAESLLGAGSHGVLPEQIEAETCVASFLTTVRKRVLAQGRVDIGAAECFALATRAVDAVYAWQDFERRRIEVALGSGKSSVLELAGR